MVFHFVLNNIFPVSPSCEEGDLYNFQEKILLHFQIIEVPFSDQTEAAGLPILSDYRLWSAEEILH
jgi:hypothetical protein